ncbi:MAG: Gfo/Idh/MocA family oxidoreductase, partial [Phycisphaerales bacterium]|nr:Gfo/Idh/MocA family oxidoreductase [Phycisphaerales bacterium]
MRRIAMCGASGRGSWYAERLTADYRKYVDLVGIFDINIMRATFVRDSADKEIPVYTDFDKMLTETKPDCVLVVTMDSTHHEYCVRSLDAGCDVICEKPMTIDAEKTKAIFEAEKRNNRKIAVTFN